MIESVRDVCMKDHGLDTVYHYTLPSVWCYVQINLLKCMYLMTRICAKLNGKKGGMARTICSETRSNYYLHGWQRLKEWAVQVCQHCEMRPLCLKWPDFPYISSRRLFWGGGTWYIDIYIYIYIDVYREIYTKINVLYVYIMCVLHPSMKQYTLGGTGA